MTSLMRAPRMVFAIASLVAASACDRASPSASPAASASGEGLVAPAAPPPHEAPTIGVEECDAYFKLSFACTARFEPALRQQAEEAIQKNVAGWRGLAATPANRAELTKQCKQALEKILHDPVCGPPLIGAFDRSVPERIDACAPSFVLNLDGPLGRCFELAMRLGVSGGGVWQRPHPLLYPTP